MDAGGWVVVDGVNGWVGSWMKGRRWMEMMGVGY